MPPALKRLDLLDTLNMILGSTDEKIKISLKVVEQAMDQFKEGLWFSFNAGKDNTACFFLTAAILYKKSGFKNFSFTVPCIYFEEEDPFEECEEFMETIKSSFNFQPVVAINTENASKHKFMRSEMIKIVKDRGLKAVIMGSRRTDPHCGNLQHFTKSSIEDGWPDFVRVNPIIDWEYKEIWYFFNSCKIPYCTLYDKGYTYLGDKQDTVPNPYLRTKNGWYLPASAASSNYEPFSRKSILKNLHTNESGKIMITENNVRHIVMRSNHEAASDEIRKNFMQNIKSFEIFQSILNESSENIRFDIDFAKAIKYAHPHLIMTKIESQAKQDEVLSEMLTLHISQLSQQLRIPLYILFVDMIRKNCCIFG